MVPFTHPQRGIQSSSPEVLRSSSRFDPAHAVVNSLPGQRLTLAVTSAAPARQVAGVVDLALSFAEAGLKTVLIDGDTRRDRCTRSSA